MTHSSNGKITYMAAWGKRRVSPARPLDRANSIELGHSKT